MGAGRAFTTLRLARRGFRVRGIDFSEIVLEAARENVAEAGLADRIELEAGDLTQLSFADAEFERVLCWGVLMHVPDIDAAVSELSRVVAPGGRVIVNDANLASFDNVLLAVRDRLGGGHAERRQHAGRSRALADRLPQDRC